MLKGGGGENGRKGKRGDCTQCMLVVPITMTKPNTYDHMAKYLLNLLIP